jgi:DNA (cytosine-5)-methyltransferase 1
MSNYYNEIDPYCAQWLRNLVAAGHIPAGDVDERDIRQVKADDLKGYVQCHFFAGIGGWAYAARLAGWPDDRPLWTGSCPCQPFSNAGKKKGFKDDRHLWPDWFKLISERRPSIVFGEQVASPDGRAWLDSVQTDMEGGDYAFGALNLCAAGHGAPHARQRLFWVADADRKRWDGEFLLPRSERENDFEIAGSSEIGGLANTYQGQWRRVAGGEECGSHRWPPGRNESNGQPQCDSAAGQLGDAEREGLEVGPLPDGRDGIVRIKGPAACKAGVVRGFWRNAELFLHCDERDGRPDWKYRPVEPGSFPLVDGLPGRVEQVCAYGNAIVPQVAAEIMRAVL